MVTTSRLLKKWAVFCLPARIDYIKNHCINYTTRLKKYAKNLKHPTYQLQPKLPYGLGKFWQKYPQKLANPPTILATGITL